MRLNCKKKKNDLKFFAIFILAYKFILFVLSSRQERNLLRNDDKEKEWLIAQNKIKFGVQMFHLRTVEWW